MFQSRTHTCGELRLSDAGKTVTLAGWMENVREVGSNFAFVVLRDFYGTTQVVIESEEMMAVVKPLNKESTISVTGIVRERESKNKKIPTGEIEVVPTEIKVLGRCRYNELPFEINRSREADETQRLKYRYLDLRNPAVKQNIILRCNVVAALRQAMTEHGFLEITTPILTASSPEGARDYLVPARKPLCCRRPTPGKTRKPQSDFDCKTNGGRIMNRDLDYVMFTPEQLHARVQEIGRQLTEEYAGKAPILLCIMKGSLVFTADLMREINLPCTLEYLTLSSYRAMATTPGALDMKEPFDLDINGRDIIVIEDILDTGRTLSFVMKLLGKQSPASLKLVVLLDKPSRREAPVEADIVGFTIPDAFVVGYGLDYDQKYRNLPCIGVLKPSVYQGS